MLVKQGSQRLSIERCREDVTLTQFAAHRMELRGLIFGFYAFRYDVHPEFVPDIDDALDDRRTGIARTQACDKRSIDFDDINRDIEKMRQRCVARTKVIQRDAHAAFAQKSNLPCHNTVALAHVHVFIHFEDDMMKSDAHLSKAGFELVQLIPGIEIGGRDILADMLKGDALIEPTPNVLCDD